MRAQEDKGKDKKPKANPIAGLKARFIAPDLMRRKLIFDSLTKITQTQIGGKDSGDVDRGTRLYTWGAGYHGQLGSSTYRKKCQKVPGLLDFSEPVVQVACGGFHNAILTQTGKLYTWGNGRQGQLGNLARKHNMLSTPTLVDNLVAYKVTVVQVGCGQNHTACISYLGQLYTWGSGKNGQLGHGTKLDERHPRVVEVDRSIKFRQVACGDRHTVVTTVVPDSQIMTFGAGQHGQLGHGNDLDSLKPKFMECFESDRIKQVDASATASAAISRTGVVYLWGFGESIHPKNSSNIVSTPRVVKLNVPAKQVACGQSHVVILTVEGDVYTFGAAAMNQIGHGSTMNARSPRLVLKDKRIYEIAAGRYHSIAVGDTGALYAWGCGESGQLAHDSLDNEPFPRVVQAILTNVVGQISCGEHHSMCIASIEHAGIAADVKEWLAIEEEEVVVKNDMLKDHPSGLKSQVIANMVAERVHLVEAQRNGSTRDTEQDERHLNEQVASIRRRPSLTSEVQDSIATTMSRSQKDLFFEDQDGFLNTVPPSLTHKDRFADDEDTFNTKYLDAPQPSSAKHASTGSPTASGHAADLAKHSAMYKSASSREVVENGRAKSGAPQRPKRNMMHSESAPVLSMKKRPQSAMSVPDQQVALVTGPLNYQPLQGRVDFMEKTRTTLGNVKNQLARTSVFKPPTAATKLFPLQKEFNVLKRNKEVYEKQLTRLQSEMQYLQPTEEERQRADQCGVRIQDLNMKLVTLNTRLIEADENKKNYELYILRMKEEDVQLSKQIDYLRNLVAEYDRLAIKMSGMNERVGTQREEIDGEIVHFDDDIRNFADFAEGTVDKYRTIMQAREVAKHEDAHAGEKAGKAQNQIVAQRQLLVEESQQEEAAEVGAELDGWQGKVEYYEKRYHKISAATGLTRPEDIANKFFFNDEITDDLNKEIAERKVRIAAMKKEHNGGLNDLVRQKREFVSTKWKDVEQVQGIFEVEDKRSRRDKVYLASVLKNVATVMEGFLSLSASIEDIMGPHPLFVEAPPSDDATMTAKYWCERLQAEVGNVMVVGEEMRGRMQLRDATQSAQNAEEKATIEAVHKLNVFKGLKKEKPEAEDETAEYSDDDYDAEYGRPSIN